MSRERAWNHNFLSGGFVIGHEQVQAGHDNSAQASHTVTRAHLFDLLSHSDFTVGRSQVLAGMYSRGFLLREVRNFPWDLFGVTSRELHGIRFTATARGTITRLEERCHVNERSCCSAVESCEFCSSSGQ